MSRPDCGDTEVTEDLCGVAEDHRKRHATAHISRLGLLAFSILISLYSAH